MPLNLGLSVEDGRVVLFEEGQTFSIISAGPVRGRVLAHLVDAHPRATEHYRSGKPTQCSRVVPTPTVRTTAGCGCDAFLLVVADRVDGDAE